MLLSDKDIRELCVNSNPMIFPFREGVSGGGVISYGLSTAGYDLRLDNVFLLFSNVNSETIDPKKFGDERYRQRIFYSLKVEDFIVLPPNHYALGQSVEYLRIPPHLKGRCTGKSTYARAGILINTTPLEPGWCGHLTIEIGNVTPCPARVYVGEGICQLEFEMLSSLPEKDYAAKGGVYQDQRGVTPPRVKS